MTDTVVGIDDSSTTQNPTISIYDILPVSCTPSDLDMVPDLFEQLVSRLRQTYTDATARITDPTQTVENHCMAAMTCYAMDRLARVENYDPIVSIWAVALEHAGLRGEKGT
jgi:hypothetical protein